MSKRLLLFVIVCAMVLSIGVSFSVEAAVVTTYPASYAYVKPAPYWPCDPCDEFSTSQQVKILERDYSYFYVEYTRNGVVKRGYMSTTYFPSVNNYSWCNHSTFTPGYNSSGAAQNVYYTPTGTAVAGSIDADEGSNSDKPLLVLRYEGNRAFVQYLTNPGESGHALFKRGWVNSSAITLSPPAAASGMGTVKYTVIYNIDVNKCLQCNYDPETNSYQVVLEEPTGYDDQHWLITRMGNATTGYYYKIESALYEGRVLQINNDTAVIGNELIVEPDDSPAKSQEFYLSGGNSVFYIKSRCSGGYMGLQASQNTATTQQKIVAGRASQRWNFIKFDVPYVSTYDYYRDVTPVNGIKQLTYYIDSGSFDYSSLNESHVTAAVAKWNAHKNRTKIELVKGNSEATAQIILKTDTLGYAGKTVPTMVKDSSGIYVFRNTITIDPLQVGSLAESDKARIIAHELGHALGLNHIFQNSAMIDDDPITFNITHCFYSIMNEGPGSNNVVVNKETVNPSSYDLRMLATKTVGIPN